MIGAANADDSSRRFDTVAVLVGFTDHAGNRTQSSLDQRIRRALAAVFLAVELITDDLQLRARPHRDDCAIDHFQLRRGAGGAHHGVALVHILPFAQCLPLALRVDDTHVAGNELHPSRNTGMNQRRIDRNQRNAQYFQTK